MISPEQADRLVDVCERVVERAGQAVEDAERKEREAVVLLAEARAQRKRVAR